MRATVPGSPRGLEEEVGDPLEEKAGSLLRVEAERRIPLRRDGRLGGGELGGLRTGDATGELPWDALAAQEGGLVLEKTLGGGSGRASQQVGGMEGRLVLEKTLGGGFRVLLHLVYHVLNSHAAAMSACKGGTLHA